MKQVAVVGTGGIGSWLAYFLYDLDSHGQLNDVGFTFFDDDVVEEKNIRYQNFDIDDITDTKVESISARYGFIGEDRRVEDPKELKDYDCVVCAVDSKSFREKLFNTFNIEDEGPHWIDLRSEGRTFVFYTKHKANTTDKMLKTLPSGDAEEGSCQLEWELSEGIVQQGNKIIASIGSQLILNWHRSENSPSTMVANI